MITRNINCVVTLALAKENIYSKTPVHQNPLAPLLPDRRNFTYLMYYKAKRDFYGNTPDELSFESGDILEVVHSNEANRKWARNTTTNQCGIVYNNHLICYSIYELQPWFFSNTNRVEAVNLLRTETAGTFLVRQSMTHDYNPFALSIRCTSEQYNTIVKHYKINKGPLGFYISAAAKFDSLESLIHAYTIDRDNRLGLCQRLIKPCTKPPEYED